MRAAWLGTGPKVARFEEAFAAYKGATTRGRELMHRGALHLSLLAAGVGPGDEVITSALTFAATVNAIIHAGATPVLADVDPVTMNIDPLISRSGHLAYPRDHPGPLRRAPCDMDALMAIGRAARPGRHRGLRARHRGELTAGAPPERSATSAASASTPRRTSPPAKAAWSSPPRKDIARVKVLALHGMSKDAWRRFSDDGYRHYQVVEAGFKYNMMDLQAAIGIHQLERSRRPRSAGARSGSAT